MSPALQITTNPNVRPADNSSLFGPKAFDTLLSVATKRMKILGGSPRVTVRGEGLLRNWRLDVKREEGLTLFSLAYYGDPLSDKDARPTEAKISGDARVAKLVLVESYPDIRMTMFTGVLCPGPGGASNDDRG